MSIFFLLFGGLLSCSHLARVGRHTTNIADIQQNWQNFSTVYLQGKVGQQAPFLGSAAYQLEDATGRIWVVTQETVPREGDQRLIKGQVKYQSIPIAGQELGEVYVLEEEQLEIEQPQ